MQKELAIYRVTNRVRVVKCVLTTDRQYKLAVNSKMGSPMYSRNKVIKSTNSVKI